MTGQHGEEQHQQVGAFLLVLTFALAFGVIAVALAGAGGALTDVEEGDDRQQSPGDSDDVDQTELIGGGSLGAADRNPIGEEVDGGQSPFQSTSSELQFRVSTDYPGYWRIDAYDQYENGTWIRTGNGTEYRGQLPATGAVTNTIVHNVSLDKAAVALPTTWQPATITNGTSPLTVSSETGLHATTPARSGQRYTIESYCYNPDTAELRDTGRNYPVSIEQQYTTLPDELPNRVISLGDEITADTETPVESVEAIEAWLETNTGYSLEESPEPGTDPIDQFLFETRTGSAEYMAASMTVLLRSQDIPARYVTGYAPGHTVEYSNDTYAVREIHAHAWTEVYIAGHGWIPFDPTPADERMALENAFLNTEGEMVDTPITGECPEPETDNILAGGNNTDNGDNNGDDNGDNNGDDNGDNNGDNQVDPQSVNLTLSTETPKPGKTLTVTVTVDGEPIEGFDVLFNGEVIGATDASGQVTGIVPFNKTLEITVVAETGSSSTVPTVGTVGAAAGNIIQPIRSTTINPGQNVTVQNENETVSVSVTADLSAEADPIPLVMGGEATVQAFIDGEPLPGAVIQLGDEQIAETDADGQATVTIPESIDDDTVVLTVRRGEFETEKRVAVGELTLSVEADSILALPGQTITATATVSDEPAPEALLFQNEDFLKTTDENGTASVGINLMGETTITTRYAGQEATTQVDNQLLPVVGIGTVVVALVLVVAFVFSRRYSAAKRVTDPISSVRQQLFDVVATVLLRVETIPDAIRSRTTPEMQGPIAAIIQLPPALAAKLSAINPRAILAGIVWLGTSISGFVRAVLTRLSSSGNVTRQSTEGGDETTHDGTVPADSQTERKRSLRDMWATFVRLVFRRVDTTRTPGEIAQEAIDKGFPQRPVQRLTDAFREAEYGPDDSDPPVDDASDALTELQTEATDSTDETEQHDALTRDAGQPSRGE